MQIQIDLRAAIIVIESLSSANLKEETERNAWGDGVKRRGIKTQGDKRNAEPQRDKRNRRNAERYKMN